VPDLPDGWIWLQGISWNSRSIYLGQRLNEDVFCFWSKAEDELWVQGRLHRTLSEAEFAMNLVRDEIMRCGLPDPALYIAPQAQAHPNWARF